MLSFGPLSSAPLSSQVGGLRVVESMTDGGTIANVMTNHRTAILSFASAPEINATVSSTPLKMLTDGITMTDTLAIALWPLLVDALEVSETVTVETAVMLLDKLRVKGRLTGKYARVLLDAVEGADAADGSLAKALTDAVQMDDAASGALVAVLAELIEVGGSVDAAVSVRESLADAFSMSEAMEIALSVVVAESIDADSAFTSHLAVTQALVEQIVASETVENLYQAIAVVVAAITTHDAVTLAFPVSVSDDSEVADLVETHMGAVADVLAALEMTGSVEPVLTAVTIVQDDVLASETLVGVLTAVENLVDGVSASLFVEYDGQVFAAWVMNAETKAASKFLNYPFNSFAEVNGVLYAASQDGIYQVTGDDDEGTNIDARIESGLLDFGVSYLKRITDAYIGYASDGTVVLKMVSTYGGQKRELVYTLREQTSTSAREGKLKLARKTKALFWKFELLNSDGASLELDAIRFLPLITSRRA